MCNRSLVGVLSLILCGAFVAIANADLDPGNLVIYRVGDGSAALTNASTAVFLDEYMTDGTFVQSIAMPTTAGGGNNPLTAEGTEVSEGLLTRSVDGSQLVLTGYATGTGVANVGMSDTTGGSAVPRVVGLVSTNETINTTTTTAQFDKDNIRSAVYDPAINSGAGGTIWITGSQNGVIATEPGQTDAGTDVATNPGDLRQVNVFAGQLYTSEGTGSARVSAVGTGEPFTSGQSNTALPGLPNSDIYAFFFADLSASPTGVDTLYAADGTNGLSKFSLFGGSWVSNGSIDTTNDYYGLTGAVSGMSVSLYATRNGNELVSLVDSSGYNSAFAGTPTSLAFAPADTAFRGVAFGPAAIPEPGAFLFGGLVCGVLGLGAFGRRLVRTAKSTSLKSA